MKTKPWIKGLCTAGVIILALLRVAFPDFAKSRMDNTFYILLAAGVLILLLPWERINSLRAGDYGVNFDQRTIDSALSTMVGEMPEGVKVREVVNNQQLSEMIQNMGSAMGLMRGSKILWVDDRPYNTVSIRRLFRALGIQVETAVHGEIAYAKWEKDFDFDLVITDIAWHKVYQDTPQGSGLDNGFTLIKKIREEEETRLLPNVPIVIYTKYSPDNIRMKSKIANLSWPEDLTSVRTTGTIEALVQAVLELLAVERLHSRPVRTGPK
jgi:CheY-like chemotaxis protein